MIKGLREDALAGERDWPDTTNPSNMNRLLALDLTKHQLIHLPIGGSVTITRQRQGEYTMTVERDGAR